MPDSWPYCTGRMRFFSGMPLVCNAFPPTVLMIPPRAPRRPEWIFSLSRLKSTTVPGDIPPVFQKSSGSVSRSGSFSAYRPPRRAGGTLWRIAARCPYGDAPEGNTHFSPRPACHRPIRLPVLRGAGGGGGTAIAPPHEAHGPAAVPESLTNAVLRCTLSTGLRSAVCPQDHCGRPAGRRIPGLPPFCLIRDPDFSDPSSPAGNDGITGCISR